MQPHRLVALALTTVLAIGVGGCSVFRGPPDPAEERAAELRRPPDLRASVAQEAAAPEPADDGPRGRIARAEDGRPQLLIGGTFFQSWRLVGLALDRAGFTVEDRDRSRGDYYIRYDSRAATGAPERGFFSRMAFWRDEEPDSLQPYVVNLRHEGAVTRVTVATEAGEAAAPEIAEQILGLINEHLR